MPRRAGVLLLLIVLLSVHGAADDTVLQARAWNLSPVVPVEEIRAAALTSLRGHGVATPGAQAEYPETALLLDTSFSGIALSGGGSRAYTASIGYMRALLDLGLLNRTRYLSSVSGGSWATAAYSYFQAEAVGLSEEDFLGQIVDPEHLTMERLAQLDERSARAAPVNRDFFQRVAYNLLVRRIAPADVYAASVADVFLTPAGIPADAQVSWSPTEWARAVHMNPSLADEKVVFRCGGARSCSHKPFAILNAAVLGPAAAAPFTTKTDHYLPMEFNALYAGAPLTRDVVYPAPREAALAVGGFVETFAFGGSLDANASPGNGSDLFGLDPFHYTGLLRNVPARPRQFCLADAAAASSFAPGSLLSGSPLLRALDSTLGMRVDYWSPLARTPGAPLRSQPVLVADAASLENTGFMALLRRRVREAVVLLHSPIPLRPREAFDPLRRAPGFNDADPALTSLFGVDAEPPNVFETLLHNQVFPRFRLAELLRDMQTAQRAGSGIVVRQQLRTLANEYWDVPGGHDINVTWVYLSRVLAWEERLPEETRALVRPRRHAQDPSRLASRGPFKGFPHFPTQKLSYSAEQANLLADLSGWIVQRNRALFELALA